MTPNLSKVITLVFAAQVGCNSNLLTYSDDRDPCEMSFARASSEILSQIAPLSHPRENTTSSVKTILRFRTKSENSEMDRHSGSLFHIKKSVKYESERREDSELKFQFCAKMTKVEQRVARRRSRDFRSSLEPIMEDPED
mmetsp:Transcript_444/g.831  ORF Transcript_444/g.831 Transcript_444/m.831 type:complete len:140 (-) Transcript_444:10-429(-)